MQAQHTNERASDTAQAAALPPDAVPAPKIARRTVSPRKIIIYTLLLGTVVLGGIWGYNLYSFGLTHIQTDNAQIDGHIDPVIPHIAGYVTNVAVNDNDKVRAGDLIAEIDPRELRIRLGNAEAALQTAEDALATAHATRQNAEAALAVAQANVKTAQVARDKGADDLKRNQSLISEGVIAQQQFENARAAAAAQYLAAQRQISVAEAQVTIAGTQVQAAETQVTQRRHDLEYARLQLSYTKITAPVGGTISKKNVETGQFVQAGQPLLAITEDSTVWVTANFKETDLEQIRVGEPVEIEVDGYPDEHFTGRVASIAAATGSKFALLPPDNATGNFVKVTQRIPVKIVLDANADPHHTLRPGMSANVVVSTGT